MTEATANESSFVKKFIDYKRIIITLTHDLDKLREFSERLNLNSSVGLIDEVLERIRQDSFTVAVVGAFKRGKSTFINALLGLDILPSDILPTSATLNRVTYDVTPHVKVFFKNGRAEEIGIHDLGKYVTKLTPEAEKVAQTVKEAVIYYPVPYCRNNVDVFDTPGLNDDQNMTEVTLSVLPRVDAAILVILAQSPLDEYERDFLESKLLTSDLGRVIFVVTGIDRFNSPADADRIVQNIEGRIQRYIMQRAEEQYGKNSPEYGVYVKKIGKPKVFGLSAYQALQAKLNKDQEVLAKSRFPEFEAALEKFLTEYRGAIALQVPANRALASANDILKTINIQDGALTMRKEELYAAYEKAVAEIDTLRKRGVEEQRRIDMAAEQLMQHIEPLLAQVETDLKQAAEQAITTTTVKPEELDNLEQLNNKLAKKVSAEVQKAGRRMTDKVQEEITRSVGKEMERLQDFARSVDQFSEQIAMQFGHIKIDPTHRGAGEGIAGALAVFTGFGGIWAGYREAGAKGAAVGAVGGVGMAFGYGVLAATLSLPISWPAVITVGVVSYFTGGWLTRKIFRESRVEHFKERYKTSVLEEVAMQTRRSNTKHLVNAHISQTFEALKKKLSSEVGALLTDTQEKLAEMRGRRERDETLTETEKRELAEMRVETERILGNATRLSQQLVQVLSV